MKKFKEKFSNGFKKGTIIVAYLLLISTLVAVPVFAWFYTQKNSAAYAPVASAEALYIGAGHRDIANNHFEDIRYMYFNGINALDESGYFDRVFCVYGKAVTGYRLQLAYTTNNQFSYSLYHATESSVASEGAVEYVTHTETPETYYYSINGAAISGSYLNKTEVGGEVLATDAYHTSTYGSYSRSSVTNHAEPIYWQTTAVEVGNYKNDFVNYYILRVWTNDKADNDRETDILCIATKSFSVS